MNLQCMLFFKIAVGDNDSKTLKPACSKRFSNLSGALQSVSHLHLVLPAAVCAATFTTRNKNKLL